MSRFIVAIIVSALSLSLANAQPADQLKQDQEMQQKEMSPACDCCLQCEAARRSQVSAEEEKSKGKPKNGCSKCCIKCGKELPMKQQSPPEQHVPPEKKEIR